jgi:carboxymethylenebutenolidase
VSDAKDARDSLEAGTITITGHGGDEIEAYLARPTGGAPYGGMVVIHHMPGYDAGTKEIVRRFAARGYAALCPNLYHREAPGASPDDAAAYVRAHGGVPDERLVGDVDGAARHLRGCPAPRGRSRSGTARAAARRSAACSLDLDAAVDCYGACRQRAVRGFRSGAPGRPAARARWACSARTTRSRSGGDRDASAELDRLGKLHEFHTYEGAGTFFRRPPAYCPEAAVDGWAKIFAFLGTHLAV